jgi:hypothetical protein
LNLLGSVAVWWFHPKEEAAMQTFLLRHAKDIIGVLSGFDRVLFRGCLRSLEYLKGFDAFLAAHRVLYKDFKPFAQRLSDRVKRHAEEFAKRHGRPHLYLTSAAESKEAVAEDVARRDGIRQGLVCVLTSVEPCRTFTVRKNKETKHLDLVTEKRKCLFVYFYFMDREFGLMHVRLQSWLPMPIQVCLNGREYLARRLDRAGIGYEKRGNCFTRIEDLPRAQQMLNDLERRNWASFLTAFARRLNPWLAGDNPLDLRGYYWTIRESEYATDVMFASRQALAQRYPRLTQHAVAHFTCQDVLRFLGRRTNTRFSGEASSNIKERIEGVRVKHWVEENSIKMYDKEGSVLRVETTMNNPRRFKVRRAATRQGERCTAWLPLRKSVADLRRRVEICRAANERYFEALGVVGESSPTRHLTDPVSRRITRDGRPYRALRPIDPHEARVFTVLLDAKFLLQGFRNRDLRRRLKASAERDPLARKRASAQISRYLRLLRAHGLIRKVSKTSYYRVTAVGQQLMTTALALRDFSVLVLAA